MAVSAELKSIGHSISFHSGISAVMARRQRRARILMYHGITTWNAHAFAAQMRYLVRNFKLIALEEMVRGLAGNGSAGANEIVLIYNGADNNLVYRTGIAVFDRADPRKLVWRSDEPIFSPEKDWEKVGQVPSAVFVEGMAKQNNRYLFYYGGADKYVGIAEASIIR